MVARAKRLVEERVFEAGELRPFWGSQVSRRPPLDGESFWEAWWLMQGTRERPHAIIRFTGLVDG